MPKPDYTTGAPGNLIGGPSGVSVAKSTTVAAFLDLSGDFEGQLTCQVDTVGTAPTSATIFSAYKVYGNATSNTLASSTVAGVTSLTLSAANPAIHPNQKVLVQHAGAAPQPGEIVTVTSISGAVLTVLATVNAYSAGDAVYLISQATPNSVTPMSGTTFLTSQDYSIPLTLGTGQWAVAANNADTGQAVTITVSLDEITAYS